MAINKIEIESIQSRANKRNATNQDCLNLLEYIDDNVECEDFQDKIAAAVEIAIETAIDQADIVRAVERSVRILRNK